MLKWKLLHLLILSCVHACSILGIAFLCGRVISTISPLSAVLLQSPARRGCSVKDTALWNLDFSSSSSVQNNSLQLLLFQFQFSSFPVRSVRFSVIKNGISGFGKTHVRSNSSLVRFPSVAFQNTSSASLIDTNGPTSSFQGRLSVSYTHLTLPTKLSV